MLSSINSMNGQLPLQCRRRRRRWGDQLGDRRSHWPVLIATSNVITDLRARARAECRLPPRSGGAGIITITIVIVSPEPYRVWPPRDSTAAVHTVESVRSNRGCSMAPTAAFLVVRARVVYGFAQQRRDVTAGGIATILCRTFDVSVHSKVQKRNCETGIRTYHERFSSCSGRGDRRRFVPVVLL